MNDAALNPPQWWIDVDTPTAAQLIESERRAERRFLPDAEPLTGFGALPESLVAQITRDIRAIDDDVAEWKRSQGEAK